MPDSWVDGRELSLRQVLDAQPRARAQVLSMLKTIWDYCADDLDPEHPKPDHRKATLALQVTKQMADLFLLSSTRGEDTVDEVKVEPRGRNMDLIRESLRELEARDG